MSLALEIVRWNVGPRKALMHMQLVKNAARRLGTRAPLVFSNEYSATPWPPTHRFTMSKFLDLAQVLQKDGYMDGDHVHCPDEPPDRMLQLVHDPEYVDAFSKGTLSRQEMTRIGFKDLWSPALVRRTRLEVGGTLLAANLALQNGVACNLAGGTHHAHRSFGSGFTILNDLAVTAAGILETKDTVEKVLICDLDVHQGDGTASIFQGSTSVFTFSIHCESNFPFRKVPSALDVGLADGVGDDEYMSVLANHLPPLLDDFKPQLVLYDAGVDPHADDRLGLLKLSDSGLHRRDRLVLTACIDRGIPVAGVIGGGYSDDRWVLAERHSILHRTAQAVWEEYGLSQEAWRNL